MLPQVTHSSPLGTRSKYLRRLRGILILCICSILSLSFLPASMAMTREKEVRDVNATRHASHSEITILSAGTAIGGEIKGAETNLFGVAMQAGQYARINFQRRGIDLLVKVTSPDRSNSTYENPAGPQSPISLSIIATTAGMYTVEVQPIEKWAAAGRYQIRLEDLRSAGPQDEKRLGAERKVAEGRRKQLIDTDDSRPAALASYQEALVLWRELGDIVEEANTLHFIAQTYRLSGRRYIESCFDSYRQALERRGEEDKQAKAYTLLGLAEAHLRLDDRAALNHYKQTLELFKATNNLSGQAAAMYGMGLAKARLLGMAEALKDYEQALRIYTAPETRDRHEEARTLQAMGGAYDVLGASQEAREFLERALQGWRETGDPRQEGNTYSSLAKLEMDLGNWQVAFDTYDKAFELYKLAEATSVREKAALRRQRASTLYGVAYTYAALGDYPKAFALLDQSLALREEGTKGSAYMLKGYFQALSGRPVEALETCNKGLAEQEASGDPRRGETYTAKGAAYAMMGKHQEALGLYDQALAIQTDAKTRHELAEAITQGWRGESLAAIGEYENALTSYTRARALWMKNKDLNGVAVALIGMARAERARNNLSAALDYVTEAIATIEPLRTNVTSEELRTFYFATKIDYYELYIDLNMQLAEGSNKANFTAAAFEASERARARSLIETLSKARFEGGLKTDRELADLVGRYRYIQREIKAVRKNQTSEVELQAKQAKIEEQLRAEYPRYAALMFPQPLKVTEVQKLLDADTLLLEFSLGEERSYVWAVTATELRGYKLPPRSEIEGIARQLINHLRAGQRVSRETASQHLSRVTSELMKYWPQATAFSRLLLGRIPALSQKKHLVIVADGQLQYLPFAALPAPNSASSSGESAPTSVLVRDHEITNLPSASVLSILRETAGRERPAKLLAVFADPVFEKDDPRIQFTRRRKAVTPAAANGNGLAEALRDVDGVNGANELPRLQASGWEARQIIDLAGRASSLEQTGFKANRENATSKRLGDYRIVHFATHGILDEVKPERSGMVLSLYDQQGRFRADGYLHLKDIYGLNLPVELVVLSACHTGLGKPVRGEGLIGLARGFMYAGTQRVLASLWRVDNEATAELMKRFYQKMLKEGMTPAAALSAAQWSMYRDSRWSNPYYWAGFILQGESR